MTGSKTAVEAETLASSPAIARTFVGYEDDVLAVRELERLLIPMWGEGSASAGPTASTANQHAPSAELRRSLGIRDLRSSSDAVVAMKSKESEFSSSTAAREKVESKEERSQGMPQKHEAAEEDLANNTISESTHLRNRYGQLVHGVLCDVRRAQEAAARRVQEESAKDGGGTRSTRTARSLDLHEVRQAKEGSRRRSAPSTLPSPSPSNQMSGPAASNDKGEDLTTSKHVGVMRDLAKEQDAALKELEKQLTALHADMGVGSVHLTELKKPAPAFKRPPQKKKKKGKSVKLGYYTKEGDRRHQ